MTTRILERLRELEKAATCAPWFWQVPMNQWDHCTIRLENGGNILNTTSYGQMRDDAALVVAARNALPLLLDYIQVIEDAIEESPDDFMLRCDLMQRFKEVRQAMALDSAKGGE